MKNICLLLFATCINISLFANGNYKNNKLALGDSTLHQRFIMSLLQEYEREGRWFFIQIDSMYNLKNNFEVINPKTLYNVYASKRTDYYRKLFLFDAYETLTHHLVMERYSETPLLKGNRVNMKIYKILLLKSKEKILSTYFNTDKTLKKQYKKWLYEIIAVCYTNNVKVVTTANAQPYFEAFK